jgi:hypothetical protein
VTPQLHNNFINQRSKVSISCPPLSAVVCCAQEAAERRALAAQQAADAVESQALQRLEVMLHLVVGLFPHHDRNPYAACHYVLKHLLERHSRWRQAHLRSAQNVTARAAASEQAAADAQRRLAEAQLRHERVRPVATAFGHAGVQLLNRWECIAQRILLGTLAVSKSLGMQVVAAFLDWRL